MLLMTSFRQFFARLGLVLMVALMALYIISEDFRPTPARPDNGSRIQAVLQSVADDTEDVGTEFVQMEKEQRLLINKLRNICSTNVLQNVSYNGKGSYKFYRSRAYNIGYCKVPKSGSSFWIRTLSVLDNGITVAMQILKKSRKSLHSKSYSFKSSLLSVLESKSPTILSARNPYSRLYSAYIDKFYLFLMWKLILDIPKIDVTNKTEMICPQAVSFEDFLQWILREASQGKTLNRHWAPIFSLCKPCDVVPISIVHQETFAKDLKFTLQQIKVNKDKYEFITSSLQGNRVETELPGVIETVYSTVKKLVKNNCINWTDLARRTWSAFQIQGYIANEVNFPTEQFKNLKDASNVVKVSEIIISEIHKHPMLKEETHNQRNMALQAAYSDVGEETIVGIQQLYKEDFLLFGYSFIPPNKEGYFSQ